jgi:hypothetical protein
MPSLLPYFSVLIIAEKRPLCQSKIARIALARQKKKRLSSSSLSSSTTAKILWSDIDLRIAWVKIEDRGCGVGAADLPVGAPDCLTIEGKQI